MADSIGLATIFASVELTLVKWNAQVAQVKRDIESVNAKMATLGSGTASNGFAAAARAAESSAQSQIGSLRRVGVASDKIASDRVAAEKAIQASIVARGRTEQMVFDAENRFARLRDQLNKQQIQGELAFAKQRAQAAREAASNSSANMQRMGGALLAGGGVTLGALAVAAGQAAKFQKSLVDMRNNTSMTDAEFKEFEKTVIHLGVTYGGSMDQISQAFMRAKNHGFDMADSIAIVTQATRSAVATGSDIGQTANVLSQTMHIFNLRGSEAAAAMNTLHQAALLGNTTMQEFVDNFGEAEAVAAGFGLKLADVSATFSAMTQNGLNAAISGTQLRDVIQHIVNPKVHEELKKISKATGVDLVRDFTAAGLQSKGLTHVLIDIADASKKYADQTHSTSAAIIEKLIPAQRGAFGAIVTTNNGAEDLRKNLVTLSDTMSGKLDPTTQGVQRQLQTFDNNMQRLQNSVVALSVSVGQNLLPQLTSFVQSIKGLVDGFNSLSPETQDFYVKGTEIGGMLLIIGSGMLGLASKLVGLRAAYISVTAAETATASEGVAAFAAGSPYVAGLAVVAGAVYLIYQRWKDAKQAQEDYANARVAAYQPGSYNSNASGQNTPAAFQANKNIAEANRIANSAEYKNLVATVAISKANIAGFQKQLGGKFDGALGTNSAGMTRAGVQSELSEEVATLNTSLARLHDLNASINALKGDAARLTASGSGVGAAGQSIAAAIASGAAAYVKTPAGAASCALWAEGVMKSVGVAIGSTASAGGLRDELVKAGAKGRSWNEAKPGDVIVFEGGNYGARQKGGARSGFHIGIAGQDPSRIMQSSNGRVSTESIWDELKRFGGKATAYTVPDSLLGAHGKVPLPTGSNAYKGGLGSLLQTDYKPLKDILPLNLANAATNAQTFSGKLQLLDDAFALHMLNLEKSGKGYSANAEKLKYYQARLLLTANALRNIGADESRLRPAIDTEGKGLKSAEGAYNAYKAHLEREKRGGGTVTNDEADRLQILRDNVQKARDLYDQDYAAFQEDERGKHEAIQAEISDYRELMAVRRDMDKIVIKTSEPVTKRLKNVFMPGMPFDYNDQPQQKKTLADLATAFDVLRDKRDLFLNGWQQNGETFAKYTADLRDMYNQIAAAVATGDAEQNTKARLLLSISEAAKQAKDNVSALPKAFTELRDAMSNALGGSVTHILDHWGQHTRPGEKRMSQWSEITHSLRDAGRQTINSGIGRLAGQGMSSLLGGLGRQLFGGNAAGKPDGSKGKPFNVVNVGSGAGSSAYNDGSGTTSVIDMVKNAIGGGATLQAIPMGGASMPGRIMGDLFGMGGGTPGIAPGSVPSGAGGGLNGMLSSITGLGGLFKSGGIFSHLLSGGALKGITAAMPWIGGGMLLNSVLGNPLGKLFKHFHLFSEGGIVPGIGHHDSVPALLTPGEHVLTERQMNNVGHTHYHSYNIGDINVQAPAGSDGRSIAWQIRRELTTATGQAY